MKLTDGMTWESKLYAYRLRIEPDMDPQAPWEDYDGQLCNVQQFRHEPDFCAFDSGEHDPRVCQTTFWESLAWDQWQTWYIFINLTDAAKKHIELMGKPHQGRYNLIQWIKQNMESEAKIARQYLEGEVYGFTLDCRELPNGQRDQDFEWEYVDSCWGFYGDDPNTNGMAEYVNPEQYIADDLETFNANAVAAYI
jgi:hypothetical protein